MAENNNNKGTDNKSDKNLKPKFNSNWIFAILAISFIAIQLIYSGKTTPKALTRDLMEMISNRDIERLVIVNKEIAEIYLTKEALQSDRHPDINVQGGGGMGLGAGSQKPHYTYNIADISTFEPFP